MPRRPLSAEFAIAMKFLRSFAAASAAVAPSAGLPPTTHLIVRRARRPAGVCVKNANADATSSTPPRQLPFDEPFATSEAPTRTSQVSY